MKLRRLPEDFQVTELTQTRPAGGPFALYRLTKTSIGTPEAIHAIVKRWGVHRKRISYGGLKDRHAVTTQHLTIHNGPRGELQQSSFHVEYLGQTAAPFSSHNNDGNRFRIVMRDMTESEVRFAESAAISVPETGLPNYFDDQRFGSLGQSGEWIARAWCLGNWERALWLALADPHEHDSSSEKQQKQLLRDLWGQWPECQRQLDRSHRRSIVTYMADKVNAGRDPDFRGAMARISVDLRGLYLSAYQSALWNRLLTRAMEHMLPSDQLQRFELLSGPAVFPLARIMATPDGDTDLSLAELPLPSARIERPDGVIGNLLDEVLAKEQIELRQLRVKYPRDSFFSKGMRAVLMQPSGLSTTTEPDELYAGRSKLTLSFELPRGSYATMLIKRLSLNTHHDD